MDALVPAATSSFVIRVIQSEVELGVGVGFSFEAVDASALDRGAARLYTLRTSCIDVPIPRPIGWHFFGSLCPVCSAQVRWLWLPFPVAAFASSFALAIKTEPTQHHDSSPDNNTTPSFSALPTYEITSFDLPDLSWSSSYHTLHHSRSPTLATRQH